MTKIMIFKKNETAFLIGRAVFLREAMRHA